MADAEPPRAFDFPWHVVRRIQEIHGEGRANLLRVIAVALFYGVEVAATSGIDLGFLHISYVRSEASQQAITALCAAWALMALGVWAALRNRLAPAWLKYATTLSDVAFLTGVLTVSEGPRSPMIVGYLLIIALASLRMSLNLVRTATAAAALGYLWLLGWAKWFAGSDLSVPRYHQVVFVLAVVMLGVMLGQVLRRARALAEAYAERREDDHRGVA